MGELFKKVFTDYSRECGMKRIKPKAPAPLVRPNTYRPPIENICAWCSGKHVGSCDKNACSDVGRIGAA